MSPYTAKAIKDIISALDRYYGSSDGQVYVVARQREVLEKALHDFAENVRTDAIEP